MGKPVRVRLPPLALTVRVRTCSNAAEIEELLHYVYELDPDGKQLRFVKYTDYTAEKVRSLYPNASELRKSGPWKVRAADGGAAAGGGAD